jgi:hypothetical protein
MEAGMRECLVPSRLWDYGLVYISEIQSLRLDQRNGPDLNYSLAKLLKKWNGLTLTSLTVMVLGSKEVEDD